MSIRVTTIRPIQLPDNPAKYVVMGSPIAYGPTEKTGAGIRNPGEILENNANADLYVISTGESELREVELPYGLPVDVVTQEELDLAIAGFVNIKSLGAKGDGVTDDYNAIKLAQEKSGELYWPPGTYRVSKKLTLKPNERWRGAGVGATIIEPTSGSNLSSVIEGEDFAGAGIYDSSVEHITIDGNRVNNPTSEHGIKIQGQNIDISKTVVRNVNKTGYWMELVTETKKKVTGLDSKLSFCRAITCGEDGFHMDSHDMHVIDCQAIQCREVGFRQMTVTYMYGCHTWCYASDETVNKTGYEFQGQGEAVNCIAEGSSERQVLYTGSNGRWVAGNAFASTGKPNVPLFEFNGGASIDINGVYCKEYGEGAAFKFTTEAPNTKIRAHCFDAAAKQAVSGTPAESVQFDLTIGGAGGFGTGSLHARRMYTFKKYTPGSVPNNTIWNDNATERLKYKDAAGVTSYLVPLRDRLRVKDPWKPEGTKAENFSRATSEAKNLTTILTSGTLYMIGGLILPTEEEINTIHIYTATTAAVEPTHHWVVLLNQNERKILARSADKTNTAINANSKISYALEAGFKPTSSEEPIVYVGYLVTATTTPTLAGIEHGNSFPRNQAPIICGTSNTGLTTPLAVGESVNAITGTSKLPYVTVN